MEFSALGLMAVRLLDFYRRSLWIPGEAVHLNQELELGSGTDLGSGKRVLIITS